MLIKHSLFFSFKFTFCFTYSKGIERTFQGQDARYCLHIVLVELDAGPMFNTVCQASLRKVSLLRLFRREKITFEEMIVVLLADERILETQFARRRKLSHSLIGILCFSWS